MALSSVVPLPFSALQQLFFQVVRPCEHTCIFVGAHSSLPPTCRSAHLNNTGFQGWFQPGVAQWPSPSNRYFIDLLKAWQLATVPGSGRLQVCGRLCGLCSGRVARSWRRDGVLECRMRG